MADDKQYDFDAILDELQAKAKKVVEEDPVVKKKPVFELNLDLDSEYADPVETAPIQRTVSISTDQSKSFESVHTSSDEKKNKPSKKRVSFAGAGCLSALLYVTCVLAISGILSYFVVVGGLDYTGLNRSEQVVDVVVPEGSSTRSITDLLYEKGLLAEPFVFRMYAKLTGADGKWQPGEFSLSPNMGYKLLIQSLQATKARDTVTVLIPEGFTIDKIAKRLEEKKVCTAAEFYRAISEVDYSKDYPFLKESQKQSGYNSRFYKLEGFLFPDTYQFYENCSGETVVRKLLDNFENRLDTTIRSAMSARGVSMDELVILASIVQGEAATREDMQKVSRVLYNRLSNTAAYPKLQCDSTRDYITKLVGTSGAQDAILAYDTYQKDGLPVGAINNPGLDAIRAVLIPSEDKNVMGCYFFATDYDTGKTYFSKTYEQHVSICKRYGIGMYG